MSRILNRVFWVILKAASGADERVGGTNYHEPAGCDISGAISTLTVQGNRAQWVEMEPIISIGDGNGWFVRVSCSGRMGT